MRQFKLWNFNLWFLTRRHFYFSYLFVTYKCETLVCIIFACDTFIRDTYIWDIFIWDLICDTFFYPCDTFLLLSHFYCLYLYLWNFIWDLLHLCLWTWYDWHCIVRHRLHAKAVIPGSNTTFIILVLRGRQGSLCKIYTRPEKEISTSGQKMHKNKVKNIFYSTGK